VKQIIFRGKTITHDDALQAMEVFDKEFRASFPQKKWVTYAIDHAGQLYPPKTLFRLITNLDHIPGGGKPINSKFEELGFNVITLDEPPQPVVSHEGADEDAIETALSLESDLEDSLVSNLEQLERGLKLYQENGLSGEQVDAGPAGRIDLLGIDSRGNIVVIELKAGEADRQVCGQIQAYMGWIKDNLASSREVRGIIVASEFTDRMKYAVKVVPNLVLKKYQIVFRFSDASAAM
jgi:hypothetical protein